MALIQKLHTQLSLAIETTPLWQGGKHEVWGKQAIKKALVYASVSCVGCFCWEINTYYQKL